VDLAVHPIPPRKFRRFRGAGAPEVVLVARVNDEHLAGVSGACPRCGDGLRYDPRGETVICLRDGAVFRLDGMLLEGPPGLRLRTYPCLRAGQRVEVDVLHS
jgi:nitrite reductase/ring-hydroxylating ferredoxin subunit